MEDPITRETQMRREALFAMLVSSFMARDFAAMKAVLSEDPVLMFPGSSEVAGTYRGIEGIDRYLVTIRDLVRPNGKTSAYTHRVEEMVASHEIGVFGASGAIDMTMRITLTFDRDKVAVVSVRPEDVELFDRVVAPPASLAST